MSLDLQALASKLRRYRNQFNSSVREVAERTGIAEERIDRFEAGNLEPTGDEILILADYFKCDFRFFISNEQVAPFEQTDILFRSHGKDLATQDRWAIQEFLFLCECEELLHLDLGQRTTRQFSFTKRGKYYKEHGIEAAASLRKFLGYKSNEIHPDIFATLRLLGLHVFRRKLANRAISGLYIRHPWAGRCVLVNYDEDPFRQQFTVAHEAGHALLDDEVASLSFANTKASDLSEIRANNFASHLLMPPEFLRRLAETRDWGVEKAANFALKLRVSPTALSIALKEMGALSPAQAAQLKATHLPRDAKQDPEISPILSPRSRQRRLELLERGLSNYYVALSFDAYRRGLISAGRLAEMLLVEISELGDIADLFGEALEYAS